MSPSRRRRSSFTATLEAICKRIDATSSAALAFEWNGIAFSSHFTLESLWVAGSYARGAPLCGDLDLIAEISIQSGTCPPEQQVSSALLKSPKDVRLYIGTPERNTSGVAFAEARLIWQRQHDGWRSAIAAIPLNLGAGHFNRPADRIPLRPEQLRCDIDTLEELMSLEEQGTLQWEFEPFATPTQAEPISPDELELARVINDRCGQQTRKLLPHLLTYFRQANTWMPPSLRCYFEPTCFGVGGAKVLVGRPTVPFTDLDALSTSELLIVPHFSARGPNGVWRIARGPNHPLVHSTATMQSWCLVDAQGQPDLYFRADQDRAGSPADFRSARGIDLFTSQSAAEQWANECHDEDSDALLSARALSPSELLSCLARVDVASIDMTDFALTWRGRKALGCDDLAPTSSLLSALADQTRRRH